MKAESHNNREYEVGKMVSPTNPSKRNALAKNGNSSVDVACVYQGAKSEGVQRQSQGAKTTEYRKKRERKPAPYLPRMKTNQEGNNPPAQKIQERAS